jgi:hypothetical protein
LNESTLRREERGRIDYWSRSNFVLLFRFGRLSSGRSSRSASFATASSLAAATRISGFATASGLAAALLFAATATEDAIQQGHAATLLYNTFGSFATAGGLCATARVGSFATTSGLCATAGICTAAVTRLLFAVMTTQQVQQRGPAALLGSATTANVTTFVATFVATASRLSAATGIRTTGIRTTGVTATVAAALLAFLASTQQVQQRCLAALGLAGHTLHIASSITAAAGAWIRNGCVTTAGFVAAAVVVRSEHSVE